MYCLGNVSCIWGVQRKEYKDDGNGCVLLSIFNSFKVQMISSDILISSIKHIVKFRRASLASLSTSPSAVGGQSGVKIRHNSVQSLSHVQLFATPWTAAHQASLSITNSWSLLKYVHWVSHAIQPSHPLLPPSPPTFNLSPHQGLFKWVSSSHQVAKVLEFWLQHQFFQWIFRTYFLGGGNQDWFPLGGGHH